MVKKIILTTLILLPAAGWAADPSPVAPSSKPGAATASHPARIGKGAVRLEEVRITGTPEHPGVLFFLPRARFHLLPLRTEGAGRDTLPAEGLGKGAPAR